MSSEIHRKIREALQRLPALAATGPGNPPKPDEIFFPREHARALDPQTVLVVGNRGMGKSFWANVLAREETRSAVARAYHRGLEGVEARFVFASGEGGESGISRAEIESVGSDVPAETIWRAAVLPEVAPKAGLPRALRERVEWIRSHPEGQREVLLEADRALVQRGRRLVLLFDALDQLAGSWPEIQRLTEGLLKLALALQSYRAIRIKIFMRLDQFESPELFRFPDASKIQTGHVRLSWPSVELYGLLFFELLRRVGDPFLELCASLGINVAWKHDLLDVPFDLLEAPQDQAKVFHAIAGPFMGKNEKRGFPYTWLPVHLADAHGEVAPRTFLHALRGAALHVPAPGDRAIDYLGIQDGVRNASEQRLRELEEDYPWVSKALEPLRGLQVPSEPEAILGRWREGRTLKTLREIRERHGSVKAPLGIDLEAPPDVGRSLEVLLDNLRAIGVMELRTTGKIDIPDIFRVKAGILRKGGVTPQQRRRL